jgi:ABC-2 type transport system permease protein
VTGFADAARMEWIKLRTVRSTGWILVISAVAMIGLAILLTSDVGAPHHMSAADLASFDPTQQALAVGLVFVQLVAGLLGVLVITTEYSSGMIRATLAAVPGRPLLLAAKAAVLAAVTLAVGEVLAFAAFFVGEAVLYSGLPHASLGQPGVARAVLMAGAYPGLIALTGLGLGAIIRNTAAAVSTIVGVLYVLPLAVLPLPHQQTIDSYMPIIIAQDSLAAVKPIADSLPSWLGLAMLCLYAAVVLAAGCLVLARRDA